MFLLKIIANEDRPQDYEDTAQLIEFQFLVLLDNLADGRPSETSRFLTEGRGPTREWEKQLCALVAGSLLSSIRVSNLFGTHRVRIKRRYKIYPDKLN